MTTSLNPPTVAYGPVMSGWGSWNWIGGDLSAHLSACYTTSQFGPTDLPSADVVVLVKHAPNRDWLEAVATRSAVVYCPVDFYGSPAEIEADGMMLRQCARVIVHCERLRRWFEPYARVEYLDHHVKFVAPMPPRRRSKGHVLWLGVRSNLPPVVEWLNAHPMPDELLIVSNWEDDRTPREAAEIGLRTKASVRFALWSRESHVVAMKRAKAAMDIKGDDFRARHKPPAKGIDFIASGLPLAMNLDSSTVEHLAGMGFDIPPPLDRERWFSRAYWEETQRFGAALRELLSLERVGRRFKRILDEVLAERGRR